MEKVFTFSLLSVQNLCVFFPPFYSFSYLFYFVIFFSSSFAGGLGTNEIRDRQFIPLLCALLIWYWCEYFFAIFSLHVFFCRGFSQIITNSVSSATHTHTHHRQCSNTHSSIIRAKVVTSAATSSVNFFSVCLVNSPIEKLFNPNIELGNRMALHFCIKKLSKSISILIPICKWMPKMQCYAVSRCKSSHVFESFCILDFFSLFLSHSALCNVCSVFTKSNSVSFVRFFFSQIPIRNLKYWQHKVSILAVVIYEWNFPFANQTVNKENNERDLNRSLRPHYHCFWSFEFQKLLWKPIRKPKQKKLERSGKNSLSGVVECQNQSIYDGAQGPCPCPCSMHNQN